MSPTLVTSKGGTAEKDMDERARVDTGRSVEPGESGDVEPGIGRDTRYRAAAPETVTVTSFAATRIPSSAYARST